MAESMLRLGNSNIKNLQSLWSQPSSSSNDNTRWNS